MSAAQLAASGVDLTSRDRAYDWFKARDGKAQSDALVKAKEQLRSLRATSKATSRAVNEYKGEIDALEAEIAEKKAARLAAKSPADDDMEEDVVDEEEFVLMKREREAKKAYRAAYETLRATRLETESVVERCDKLKYALVGAFEEWHGAALAEDLSPRARDADGDDNEKLDDQEAFDKLEIERVIARDPDEFAYFQAQKTRRANQTQQRTALRQMHKNKRAS